MTREATPQDIAGIRRCVSDPAGSPRIPSGQTTAPSLLLPPLCNVLDALSLLSVRQHYALLPTIALALLAWFGGARPSSAAGSRASRHRDPVRRDPLPDRGGLRRVHPGSASDGGIDG